MKTHTHTVFIVIALVAYWLGLCNASAFYDPGAQRWLNRDPLGERGFQIIKAAAAMPKSEFRVDISTRIRIRPDSLELYTFAGNAPDDYIDIFGLKKDTGALIDALWEATKAGVDYIGEEASLLEIFGGCGGLGVALQYAKTQWQNCMLDAFADKPCNEASDEAKCKIWKDKMGVMEDIQNKECKGKS